MTTYLDRDILKWHRFYRRGEVSWSIAHYTTVFGAILCSVIAGTVLVFSQDAESGKHWGTFWTSIAAALGSIGVAGGFQAKWRSNRLSRSQIDCIAIDLLGASPDLPGLAAQLKKVIAQHDLEIVSTDPKNGATGDSGDSGDADPANAKPADRAAAAGKAAGPAPGDAPGQGIDAPVNGHDKRDADPASLPAH